MTRAPLIALLALALQPACEQHDPLHAPPPADAASARCEHTLPRELCTKCNPALAAVFRSKGDWCAEHGFPESFCPLCRPGAAIPEITADDDSPKAVETRIVRFRSPDIEAAVGITTVNAERAEASATIECTARIAFDSDRVADIRALVPGIVRRVRAELGAKVDVGAPLFDLESTRVSEIQGALQAANERVRAAEANLARQRELHASEIAAAKQVEVAERELASAEAEARAASATLRMAGAARSAPSGRYTLVAPMAGTVVRRPAVMGLLATESESLATLADTSVMWALCDVPEADAGRVALGQKMVVTLDGSASQAPSSGVLTWIAAEVDPRTRTVAARAELPNPEGRLRANQFARARIHAGGASAVMVPRAAVQRVGAQEVVFVRTAQGVYEPRVVQRDGDGERVAVQGRLQPGDAVVTTGAVLLRTEIMPGSIGAGCCEVGHLEGK